MNRDMRILMVPQTILHDRSYSASKCVCSCYINIKSYTVHMKINLNYNGATVEVFLLNSEPGLWYDGRCDRFQNFESARQFRIESESSDSNRMKLRRSLSKLPQCVM